MPSVSCQDSDWDLYCLAVLGHLIGARRYQKYKDGWTLPCPAFIGCTVCHLISSIKISQSNSAAGMRFKGEVHSALDMLNRERKCSQGGQAGLPREKGPAAARMWRMSGVNLIKRGPYLRIPTGAKGEDPEEGSQCPHFPPMADLPSLISQSRHRWLLFRKDKHPLPSSQLQTSAENPGAARAPKSGSKSPPKGYR